MNTTAIPMGMTMISCLESLVERNVLLENTMCRFFTFPLTPPDEVLEARRDAEAHFYHHVAQIDDNYIILEDGIYNAATNFREFRIHHA